MFSPEAATDPMGTMNAVPPAHMKGRAMVVTNADGTKSMIPKVR